MRSLLRLGRALRAGSESTADRNIARRSAYPGAFQRARLLALTASSVAAVAASGIVVSPQSAVAAVTAGPEWTPGVSGLPDGRIYEQASPTNKYGNEAGSPVGPTPPYIVSGPGGDEVAYYKSGPFGETPTGLDFFSVSRRLSAGWVTRGVVPRTLGVQALFASNPEKSLAFSSDMAATVVGTYGIASPEQEPSSPTPHLYLFGEDGSVQWLGKPSSADPAVIEKYASTTGYYVGASPDFSRVFFEFQGALTPEDDERVPAFGNLSRHDVIEQMNQSKSKSDRGFYEWHEGALKDVGVLPNGHVDPYGVQPAGIFETVNFGPGIDTRHGVSEDGRDAFFISPMPANALESGRTSELYVRETAPDGSQKTVLVSRDLLLPENEGQPAAAPGGVKEVGTFKASPDGSRAFFASKDQLTSEAPNDATWKEYEFDTRTEQLSYLPISLGSNVIPEASIGSVSEDGSTFVVQGSVTSIWHEGKLTQIAPNGAFPANGRITPSGSVYVFQSKSPFSEFSFNNGGGSFTQVYRYDVAGESLTCISCPPKGVAPKGNASLSNAFGSGNLGNTLGGIVPGNHAITEDGKTVFFDTTDPLLYSDTNGRRDAYEWNDGVVSLISKGTSPEDSFFGDNGPSGGDVFFSTSESLLPGDTDGAYDVYDARVPRPGDQLPPAAVPCEGAVCQGPPSVPNLLGAPASESFSGAGNLVAAPSGRSAAKSLTRAQKLARALRVCKSKRNRRRRAACERSARHRYGAKASRSSKGRHGNGRGK